MDGMLFDNEHYMGSECSQLDTIFLTLHTAMTMVHRRVLVAPNQEYIFNMAIIMFTATLLLKHFQQRLYQTWRTQIVFVIHLLLTTLRALAVSTMAAKQAIHWRNGLTGSTDSPALMVVTILSVLGGPFRAFEMLGLQQPFALHVLVTAYFLIVHSAAAVEGCRLAFSNALFFLIHEVHDNIAALMDTFLESLVPLPVTQQATCSSCAGVVVYLTFLLFGSVAMPLYLAYAVEQAARQRFIKRVVVAAAAAAAAGHAQVPGNSLQALPQGTQPPLQQRQQEGDADLQENLLQQHQQPPMFYADLALDAERRAAGSTGSNCPSNGIARWAMHALLVLALLLLCWLIPNVIALYVLPQVLSSQQLAFWCPNRPPIPFLIAGKVYDPHS